MKITLGGCLRLKPFDEQADSCSAGENFSPSFLLDLGVNASTLTAIAALLAVLSGSLRIALTMVAITIALSAVTAGLEWHQGLKAHSLNHLFATAVYTAFLVFLM